MNSPNESMVTLFDWNILVLPTNEQIFVGLRERPPTVPPFLPPDDDDSPLPFVLTNSSPIERFDEETGVGYTESGGRYVVIGQPRDPTGMIQFSVNQMLPAKQIRWKYDFAS